MSIEGPTNELKRDLPKSVTLNGLDDYYCTFLNGIYEEYPKYSIHPIHKEWARNDFFLKMPIRNDQLFYIIKKKVARNKTPLN
jgi:hypothetical protein